MEQTSVTIVGWEGRYAVEAFKRDLFTAHYKEAGEEPCSSE